MTKLVNGDRVEMTPEEERAHLAAHPLRPITPNPSESDVICEALKAKSVLTESDLNAARQRLSS